MNQRIKNTTGEKALKKTLVEVIIQRIINAVDEKVLREGTEIHSESKPSYNKTQDVGEKTHKLRKH